jgi:peptidyl-prolyl cis-trans isomerase C
MRIHPLIRSLAARHARAGFLLGVLVGAGAVIGAVQCSRKSPTKDAGEYDDLVLAKVAGQEYTVRDLKTKVKWQFRQIGEGTGPSMVRQQMEVFRDAVDQMCLVRLGEKKGYDKEQEFKDVLELSRRFILSDRTMQKEVRDKEAPTDDEITAYFQEHASEYAIPTRVQVAHVLVKTRAEAETAHARMLAGESVGNVARRMSIDEPSKKVGGVLGWMTETSGAGHLGRIPEINAAAMQLKKGEVSEPVQVGDEWTVLYAIDRTEPTARGLDPDVKEAIRQKVQTRKHNEMYKSLLERLRDEYGVELYDDNFNRYALTFLSDDDLWTVALGEKDAARKVGYYEEIVRRAPTGPRAGQALFMVGFVRADELKQFGPAREAFEKFLKDYPDNGLAASARWMIENMEKPNLNVEELREIRRQVSKR